MKNYLLAGILAINIVTVAWAQNDERTMVVAIQPGKAVMGTLALSYQHKINDFLAINVPVFGLTNLGPSYMAKGLSLFTGDKYDSSLWFGGLGLGARFLLNNNGFNDGFYLEPRLSASYSKYNVNKDSAGMIDSKRVTIHGTLAFGYSWFFNSGVYLSPGIEVGAGFHAYNDTKIDPNLTARLDKEFFSKYYTKYMMWAEDGRWRPDFGCNMSIGYSW